jgi:DNA-binding winged helix-turn-helix (wHTH) protein
LPTSDPSVPISADGRATGPVAARGVVRFGDCRFDPGSGLLWRDGNEIALTPRTSRLLEAFLEQPGAVLGRGQLLESVWDGDIVEEDALTQAVSLLRTALGVFSQEVVHPGLL